MKEKRPFKRFDGFSALAMFGVLAVLLVECFFIFEVYLMDFKQIEPYVPAAISPVVERWLTGSDSVVEPELDVPADTNAPPVEVVPVG